ncbi:hypothetical protein GE21DRAFT_7782 [Neurospora crassa]|uniref:Uncharacterized protein n=2 Tax=Neurospora crassa TaxID=5141 RepID=Q1K7S8_NEUCR|nr:hypothetical protein NCU01350 [Neurospora crassa OR74A]EAA32200.1 hypothetical protein NCU01350 [Neurospora crassa OR74A]KHE83455.1 hypothetical protein GE21DRAFT_7782 [Neurospora crassa]CAD11411.1 hypothetical protein [Neurospora crassa]|eukprot:XP_961436.1 hypothetical protein NCU01350 [Neurospora crassa OR74A]
MEAVHNSLATPSACPEEEEVAVYGGSIFTRIEIKTRSSSVGLERTGARLGLILVLVMGGALGCSALTENGPRRHQHADDVVVPLSHAPVRIINS